MSHAKPIPGLTLPDGLGSSPAARNVPERVPGAHLAVAVARVYSEPREVSDCYPRHVPEELRPARGFVVGAIVGMGFWLAIVAVCVILSA